MRRVPSTQRNSRVRRERDLRALYRLGLLLSCSLVLAIGFIFAARQHFAAVQYGYESENLRNEQQQLLEEQQRLILEKAQASNPARLDSAARKLGLMPIQPDQVGTQKVNETGRVPMALVNPSASFKR